MKNIICISLIILFVIQVSAKAEKIKTIPATVILKNGDSLSLELELKFKITHLKELLYDEKLDRFLYRIQGGVSYKNTKIMVRF